MVRAACLRDYTLCSLEVWGRAGRLHASLVGPPRLELGTSCTPRRNINGQEGAPRAVEERPADPLAAEVLGLVRDRPTARRRQACATATRAVSSLTVYERPGVSVQCPLRWPFPSPALCLPVLCVGDVFHPVDRLSVQALLDGDVCHAGRRCCSVPVLFTGREPDHIAGANLLDGSTLSLHPPAARRHYQSLAERMCMPCRPCAWLECHESTRDACWSGRLE